MKRIRVPGEMLKAVYEKFRIGQFTIEMHELNAILEAALLWLSGHPQVPTDEQAQDLWDLESPEMDDKDHAKAIAVEWQRRCFVQEEPEIDEIWMPFVRNAPQDAVAMTIYGANDTVLAKIDLESYRLRKGEQK